MLPKTFIKWIADFYEKKKEKEVSIIHKFLEKSNKEFYSNGLT